MAGVPQIGAPDGPHSLRAAAFFFVGFGLVHEYVFHTRWPVAASSATRLPRNLQHS